MNVILHMAQGQDLLKTLYLQSSKDLSPNELAIAENSLINLPEFVKYKQKEMGL